MQVHLNTKYTPDGDMSPEQIDVVTAYAKHLKEVALGGTAYQEPEASLYLPHDVAMVKETKQTLDTMGVEAVEYVFLVGIGGSNLGAMAVANALQGRLVRSDEPQLVNLDTISAADIDVLQQEVRQQLRPEQYIIFVVSKSGGTTETMANAELLLAEVFPSIETAKQRVVVITDSGSALDQAAKRQSLARLHLPKAVGGRYSVFSPVGMAPLYAMGVDIDALLQGARDIQPYAWQTDITHNPAIQLAGAVASYHECGYTVYDTFCFTPELETLGKWGRQLIGESIGKTRVTNDQTEYVGMVPTVSVGSTDLHSVGQLYLGGRKTVFTNFLSVAEPTYETVVPTNAFFADTVPMVLGQTTTTINEAILSGTMQAYCEADRPFIQTELAAITPYELGAYMQCKMMEVMYLGALLRINPFDQPQVELYKTHTKDKLAH